MPFMLIYGIMNYASFALDVAEKRNNSNRMIVDEKNKMLLLNKTNSSPIKPLHDQSYGSIDDAYRNVLENSMTSTTPTTTRKISLGDEGAYDDYSWSFSNKWLSLIAVKSIFSCRFNLNHLILDY